MWYGLEGALRRLRFEFRYRRMLALTGAAATFGHGTRNRPLLAMLSDHSVLTAMVLLFQMWWWFVASDVGETHTVRFRPNWVMTR